VDRRSTLADSKDLNADGTLDLSDVYYSLAF
jgi:hypothetical protein